MVYDLIMASLYPKRFGGKTYWYLREMGRVDGKPKMISERYLGTAADIAAATEARETAMLPQRTRHLAFGDVAAAWGVLQDLGVAAIIDEVTGPRPAGLPLSAGTYLALAALNRLVEDHRGGPVHQDPGVGAGSPPVLGRDARCHPGATGGDQPGDRGAHRGRVRAGLLVGGPGHDQLRHLH